jgi:DNA-binding transcriptional ArsR family regulator
MDGYRKVANLMKALSHPTRLRILEVLQSEDEACVCHLEARLGQRQAYISQQLAKLREVGLVVDRRDGHNIFYAVAVEGMEDLIDEARCRAVELARREGLQIVFPPIRDVSPEQCRCPKCEQKIALSEVE